MKKENKNLILIDDVKVWENNPREISSKDFDSLKKKIERWGIWKPFLVWESKKQILGGNQRYKACKELGHKEIWVEYREPKDDAEALEMAIADNESSGEWIKPILIQQIEVHREEIKLGDYKIGASGQSLDKLLEDGEDNIKGELEFTSELLEENNYIVFYFNNAIDWNFVKETLDIKSVKSLDSKEGYERIGIGRVLNGQKLIDLLNGKK